MSYEELFRKAERDLAAAEKRADALGAWLCRYVIDYSVEHLPGCPEDDCCRCPHAKHINDLLRDHEPVDDDQDPTSLRTKLALAEKRAREARDRVRFLEGQVAGLRRVNDDLTALVADQSAQVARGLELFAKANENLRVLHEQISGLLGERVGHA